MRPWLCRRPHSIISCVCRLKGFKADKWLRGGNKCVNHFLTYLWNFWNFAIWGSGPIRTSLKFPLPEATRYSLACYMSFIWLQTNVFSIALNCSQLIIPQYCEIAGFDWMNFKISCLLLCCYTLLYIPSSWFSLPTELVPIRLCLLNALRWRHNERDSVSNHQPHHCLLNRSFGRRSK